MYPFRMKVSTFYMIHKILLLRCIPSMYFVTRDNVRKLQYCLGLFGKIKYRFYTVRLQASLVDIFTEADSQSSPNIVKLQTQIQPVVIAQSLLNKSSRNLHKDTFYIKYTPLNCIPKLHGFYLILIGPKLAFITYFQAYMLWIVWVYG